MKFLHVIGVLFIVCWLILWLALKLPFVAVHALLVLGVILIISAFVAGRSAGAKSRHDARSHWKSRVCRYSRPPWGWRSLLSSGKPKVNREYNRRRFAVSSLTQASLLPLIERLGIVCVRLQDQQTGPGLSMGSAQLHIP
jgi:hypothetical protein